MYDKPIAMIENVSVDIIARLCAQTCTRNCYALHKLIIIVSYHETLIIMLIIKCWSTYVTLRGRSLPSSSASRSSCSALPLSTPGVAWKSLYSSHDYHDLGLSWYDDCHHVLHCILEIQTMCHILDLHYPCICFQHMINFKNKTI